MTNPEGPATLPHYLRPGLRVVFIGYNPAIYSAERGHYYARPGNVFWRQLNATSLVPRPVGSSDDALLMDLAGIGFTDLCPRPTVRAGELTREEIHAGALRLHAELCAHQPLVAAFSGREIFVHYGRHALGLPASALRGRDYGLQPERTGRTRLFVLPSSSGLASKWHRERQEWMHALAALVAEVAVQDEAASG